MMGDKTQTANLETILRPGQVVAGKYCVDGMIGKGGMAAVWAGTNQRTGKRVALKVILRSFASTPDAEEMFRREALAASRVNHPNVVNVFDVVDHEGMTCIVMELLDGEPFGTYLAKKGFLSTEETVALLLPAMRGVAAANAQGIVHRDLKPQNIFVCIGPDGKVLTTKVLDFGISVVVEKALDASAATVVTTHGTPAYMSPEHITNAPDIDERADVYGFGVLLFEALTGQLPFTGEPGPSLLMRILNEPPPKASTFRPDLRPEVVSIIERAMAKSPDDRFASLNQLIRALEEHFLPALPLPRSLTPMVGVPIIEQAMEATGSADSVVQRIRRAELSEEHGANETKALFVLSNDKAVAAGEASGRIVLPSEAPATETEPAPAASDDLIDITGSTRAKAIGILASAAAFVAALVVVAWMAMPRHNQVRLPDGILPSSGAQASAKPPQPAPTPAPRALPVAPAAVTPVPPPPPASAAAQLEPSNPRSPEQAPRAAEVERERAGHEPSTGRPAHQHGHGKERALAPGDIGYAGPASVPTPVMSAPKPPPPRAGSLSQDDF